MILTNLIKNIMYTRIHYLFHKTIHFVCDDEKVCDDAITLAFEKKRADDRKEWIMNYNPKDILDQKDTKISYHKFVHYFQDQNYQKHRQCLFLY